MKIIKMILFLIIGLLLISILYFFVGNPPPVEKITWGVNFSQKHSQDLGLNWQDNYLALLEDLKLKNIKLLTHWDQIEKERDNFYFNDLDWQIDQAENYGAKIILVMGMKTGRWPECHLPEWAKNLGKEEQQERILNLIEKIILRYRDSKTIKIWQVENEPFFPFGECPWRDKKFVKKEVDLVKELDEQKRPVLVTDSGELSSWVRPAQLGDIVGTTMYKKVWSKELKVYFYSPLPPSFYWRKAQLINKFFGKKVIVSELQTEPWGPKLLYDSPLEEQKKSMNLDQFRKNIEFAKKTGFDEFYLWGAEWWYWLKNNFPEDEDSRIWEEAKNLFY